MLPLWSPQSAVSEGWKEAVENRIWWKRVLVDVFLQAGGRWWSGSSWLTALSVSNCSDHSLYLYRYLKRKRHHKYFAAFPFIAWKYSCEQCSVWSQPQISDQFRINIKVCRATNTPRSSFLSAKRRVAAVQRGPTWTYQLVWLAVSGKTNQFPRLPLKCSVVPVCVAQTALWWMSKSQHRLHQKRLSLEETNVLLREPRRLRGLNRKRWEYPHQGQIMPL